MNLGTAYLWLLLAAVLEAAGDALVRVGLHSPGTGTRVGFFAAGAAAAVFVWTGGQFAAVGFRQAAWWYT